MSVVFKLTKRIDITANSDSLIEFHQASITYRVIANQVFCNGFIHAFIYFCQRGLRVSNSVLLYVVRRHISSLLLCVCHYVYNIV
jgi:hypothetical protein